MCYYSRMRNDRDYIFELRKKGLSYNEISQKTGVSKSTLSEWFSKKKFSVFVKKQLTSEAVEKSTHRIEVLNKERGRALEAKYKKASATATALFKTLKGSSLFLAGLMLYWGEGDRKSKGLVRLSNTDPKMQRVFVRFLEELCGIESTKIKGYFILYPDLKVDEMLDFWSRRIKLPKSQFSKPTVIKGKSNKRTSKYGICTVFVASTYFKVMILQWLDLYIEELIELK